MRLLAGQSLASDPDDQTAIHHVGLNELQEVVVGPHVQAGWRGPDR